MTPTPPSGIPVADAAEQARYDAGQDARIRAARAAARRPGLVAWCALALSVASAVVGAVVAARRPHLAPSQPAPVVRVAAPPCPVAPPCTCACACPACPAPTRGRR